MADKDRDPDVDNSVAAPAQIPLLEDVVEQPAPPSRPKRSRKKHMAIDLEGPVTGDLFGDIGESDKDGEPDTDERRQEPASPDEDGARNALRARADRVVDDLVAEYSSAIISRLRHELSDELHALLDDLQTERDDSSRS